MQKYLHLLGLLGCAAVWTAGCSGEAPADDEDGSGSQTAGTGSQNPPSGNAGMPGGPVAGGGAAATTAGSANAGGAPGTAGSGTAGTAGSSSAGSGTAGSAGGPAKEPIPDFKFPAAVGSNQSLSSTREVDDFDGKMARFVGSGDLGSSGNGEGQDPLFVVKAGGSLKNVILGAPAADGVHCEGSCTIENVWWEDVGEDAITLEGSSSSNQYRITGGGARKAADKVIQHNGGGTVYVKNFLVEDFSKLYRSCGNCGDQYERHAEFDTIVANGDKSVLAGVNQNYGDSAKFVNIFADITMKICERYQGNDSGDEPSSLGNGADGTYCVYSAADIAWH